MFWRIIKSIVTSKIAQQAAAVLSAIAVAWGYLAAQRAIARRQGAKQEQERQEAADVEEAKYVRRRVDAARERVQSDDDLRYRD